MDTVASQDGTTIAYEKTGEGPAVILVAGALTARADVRPLAEALSADMTVINYDRRSRGDSNDAQSVFPTSPDREVEDIEALALAIGVPVYLYGHSSGAALALHAAARVVPVKLVLHEAPFHPDSAPADEGIGGFSQGLQELFEQGENERSVELFLKSGGITDEQIDELKQSDDWAGWVANGRGLGYDSAAMGDRAGGRIPADLLRRITCPTLTLAGSETYDNLIEVSRILSERLPNAEFLMIGGANHESGPDLIAPPVKEFLVG